VRSWPVLLAALALSFAACASDAESPEQPTRAPASPSPAASATAAATAEPGNITIDTAGDRIPLTVSGTANVFEAVLFVQVIAGDEVVCDRRVMASAGTGTRGDWQTTLAFPPPRAQSVVTVRAYSRSPRDGAEENAVTRDVTLSDASPPIVIESPLCNADVQALGTLDVSGTAMVFEATLQVELVDADGAVVQSNVVTASAGAPETGTWTTTFDLAGVPTGAYEVIAYEESAADGSRQHEFAVPVRITT
jgi:hypothetical protein